MKSLLIWIACLFLVICPVAGGEPPTTLEEAVANVRAMTNRGASRGEIAAYVQRIVDDRIVSVNILRPDEGGSLSPAALRQAQDEFYAWRDRNQGVDTAYESAYATWKRRTGQCNENAHMAFHILRLGTDEPNIIEIGCDDHAYVIFGTPAQIPPDLTPAILRSWPDAWIVDPWTGTCKPTAQLRDDDRYLVTDEDGNPRQPHSIEAGSQRYYIRAFEKWRESQRPPATPGATEVTLNDLFNAVSFDDRKDESNEPVPPEQPPPHTPTTPEDRANPPATPSEDPEQPNENLRQDGWYRIPVVDIKNPEALWDKVGWKTVNDREAEITLTLRPMSPEEQQFIRNLGLRDSIRFRATRESDAPEYTARSSALNREFAKIARFASMISFSPFGDPAAGEGKASLVMTLRPNEAELAITLRGYIEVQPAGESAQRQRVGSQFTATFIE